MRLSTLFLGGVAYGAVAHVPIKSNVVLAPNEAYTLTVEAAEPMEIGWRAVQSPPCTTNCVQATDMTGGIHYAMATRLGAAKKYTPVSGTISVGYKNVSSQPVT